MKGEKIMKQAAVIFMMVSCKTGFPMDSSNTGRRLGYRGNCNIFSSKENLEMRYPTKD